MSAKVLAAIVTAVGGVLVALIQSSGGTGEASARQVDSPVDVHVADDTAHQAVAAEPPRVKQPTVDKEPPKKELPPLPAPDEVAENHVRSIEQVRIALQGCTRLDSGDLRCDFSLKASDRNYVVAIHGARHWGGSVAYDESSNEYAGFGVSFAGSAVEQAVEKLIFPGKETPAYVIFKNFSRSSVTVPKLLVRIRAIPDGQRGPRAPKDLVFEAVSVRSL